MTRYQPQDTEEWVRAKTKEINLIQRRATARATAGAHATLQMARIGGTPGTPFQSLSSSTTFTQCTIQTRIYSDYVGGVFPGFGTDPAGRARIGKGGVYLFVGSIEFAANSTGQRSASVLIATSSAGANSQPEERGPIVDATSGGQTTILNFSQALSVPAGRYFSVGAWQNSGGSLNILRVHVTATLLNAIT